MTLKTRSSFSSSSHSSGTRARAARAAVALALGATTIAAAPRAARAEDVSATGKGITGGALLGGEVVMLGEAAFGAQSGWVYLIGGVVGAGGGGYVGYLAEKNADPKISLYMLAGGMALVVPTMVGVLQAASYKVPDDYTEDRPAVGEPVAEPPRPSSAPVQPAVPGVSPAPPPAAPVAPQSSLYLHYHWASHTSLPAGGLFDLAPSGALTFSVPAVEVRPLYSAEELAAFGLTQRSELRLPLLAGTF